MRISFSAELRRTADAAAGASSSRRWRRPTAWSGRSATPRRRYRAVVMVSRFGHCLNDLLFRVEDRGAQRSTSRPWCPTTATLRALVARYGMPFHHLPVDAARPSREAEAAAAVTGGASTSVDLVVLARYMQVLPARRGVALPPEPDHQHPPPRCCPRFKGAKPYHQALRQGGQAGRRDRPLRDGRPRRGADHRAGRRARRPPDDARATSCAAGEEVESRVLARAVQWHCESRVLLNGDRTVVFS